MSTARTAAGRNGIEGPLHLGREVAPELVRTIPSWGVSRPRAAELLGVLTAPAK